jgi:hypothetical protein
MSLITLTTIAKVLKESGVTVEAILAEAGVSPEDALKLLAEKLGIETAVAKEGKAVEVSDAEDRTLRVALAIPTHILS